jgi:hypothetical protein
MSFINRDNIKPFLKGASKVVLKTVAFGAMLEAVNSIKSRIDYYRYHYGIVNDIEKLLESGTCPIMIKSCETSDGKKLYYINIGPTKDYPGVDKPDSVEIEEQPRVVTSSNTTSGPRDVCIRTTEDYNYSSSSEELAVDNENSDDIVLNADNISSDISSDTSSDTNGDDSSDDSDQSIDAQSEYTYSYDKVYLINMFVEEMLGSEIPLNDKYSKNNKK